MGSVKPAHLVEASAAAAATSAPSESTIAEGAEEEEEGGEDGQGPQSLTLQEQREDETSSSPGPAHPAVLPPETPPSRKEPELPKTPARVGEKGPSSKVADLEIEVEELRRKLERAETKLSQFERGVGALGREAELESQLEKVCLVLY